MNMNRTQRKVSGHLKIHIKSLLHPNQTKPHHKYIYIFPPLKFYLLGWKMVHTLRTLSPPPEDLHSAPGRLLLWAETRSTGSLSCCHPPSTQSSWKCISVVAYMIKTAQTLVDHLWKNSKKEREGKVIDIFVVVMISNNLSHPNTFPTQCNYLLVHS